MGWDPQDCSDATVNVGIVACASRSLWYGGSLQLFIPCCFTYVATSFVGVPFAVLIVDRLAGGLLCAGQRLDRRVPATVALLGRRTQVHHRAKRARRPFVGSGSQRRPVPEQARAKTYPQLYANVAAHRRVVL